MSPLAPCHSTLPILPFAPSASSARARVCARAGGCAHLVRMPAERYTWLGLPLLCAGGPLPRPEVPRGAPAQVPAWHLVHSSSPR